MNMKRLILVFAFAAFVQSLSGASDLSEWGGVGDWAVFVDPENGHGCLIQKDFADGIRVQLGYLPKDGGGFLAAMSKAWIDLEQGTTGTVKFLTDKAKFAGDVEIIQEDDWYGGRAFFNNPNLIVELARRRTFTVIGPRGGTFDIDLTGSARAIAMLDQCQVARDKSHRGLN
jgi:hypothetical protein